MSETTTETWETGVHLDIPEDTYHALPGLASTGIKRMLEAPAVYRWHADNPEPPKKAYDLGHAVHGRVLGVGLDEAIIPGPWTTTAAKAAVKEAREAGLIPLKPEDAEQADLMAHAVAVHPDAGPLFRGGQPEVSLIWDDPETGVRCRGRLDYFHPVPNVVVDLKTAASSDPSRYARTAVDLGSAEQREHYSDGVELLTGARPDRFLHVLVGKTPPYLVSVVDLAAFAPVAGERVRQAIDLYAKCLSTNTWPGFPEGIHHLTPPRYYAADPDLYEEF
jgi:hypothetical protein